MHLMESFEFNIPCEMAFLVGFVKEHAYECLEVMKENSALTLG